MERLGLSSYSITGFAFGQHPHWAGEGRGKTFFKISKNPPQMLHSQKNADILKVRKRNICGAPASCPGRRGAAFYLGGEQL
jgi:hypothetical protein